jgi:hypothetical protein
MRLGGSSGLVPSRHSGSGVKKVHVGAAITGLPGEDALLACSRS